MQLKTFIYLIFHILNKLSFGQSLIKDKKVFKIKFKYGIIRKQFNMWRDVRVAYGTCLENRRTGYSVPGVQISLSPPKSRVLADCARAFFNAINYEVVLMSTICRH